MKVSHRIKEYAHPGKSTIFVLLACCVFSLCAVGQAQPTGEPKRVMVLYWYNKDYPGNVVFDRTFQSTLKSTGSDQAEYYPEYFESNRFPGDEQSIALRDYLKRKYANRPIDVVVAVSDASLEFLLKYRSDIFPDSPIVYTAIKRLTPEQIRAGPGITGIVPANTHAETLDLALKLHPNTRQVFVVSGTPEHDNRFERVAREQFQPYEKRVTFHYLTDLPLEELITKTKHLPKNSIIFYLWQQSLNEEGQRLETHETLAALAPFASAPIYGMGTSNLGNGIVGGYLGGSEANGTKLAEIVLEILRGKRAQDIGLENAPASYMFDWRELRRWKISEDTLPPASIVKYRELTYWQLYKWRIIGVVALLALQTLLIMFLLIERRRRQLATEARRHLADIVESSDDAILSKDLDGRVMSWNLGAERIYGYSADEMIGQQVSKLVPADKEKELSAILESIRSGENVDHLETARMTRDGRRIEVSLMISALKDERGRIIGASSIARDITERTQAEEALRQSETRFRNMADTAPVMIWISGTDKLCNFVNKQYLDFTGHTGGQGLDFGWINAIHPDDVPHCMDIYTTHFNNREPFEMEFRLLRADGEYRWVLSKGSPRFASDGEFLGYIGSAIDIAERKEAEVQLIKAHEELGQLKNQLEAENIYLQSELQLDQGFDEIVGQSDAIKHVHFKINQVAATDLTVLIMGETGTGKELIARAIHAASHRKDRPLIKVNCAALSATLIESELFGHEKGAFTGAGARKLGRFELANGGTIFLDEIGDMPLEAQVKLLRVIQEGELERVGGMKTIKIDVRIIAATNRNLQQDVDDGTFREDLWYRLNVFPITAPPLRHRREDIPLLVEHFIKLSGKKFGKTLTSIAAGTMRNLQTHSWPGNVRELANVIERSFIYSKGSVLRIVDRFEPTESHSTVKSLEEIEKEHIVNVLERTGWRIEGPAGAAHLLGLKPSTLRARMAKLGIQRRVVAFAEHRSVS
ncbi:MAG TPA: ABC transporter substrate binding protein [Pyrinomonadaceae bacterium]|nr:ABC transporter substrate binding protein [Pyrinomonadaceae bacterium]